MCIRDRARPVIEQYPYAWLYFIGFILVSSFIVMNVIVGIVVNAISELSAKAKKDRLDKQLVNSTDLEMEISKLKQQLEVVESLLSVNKALKK